MNAATAMDWSSKGISEWREARLRKMAQNQTSSSAPSRMSVKWVCPDPGVLKLNVDAAYCQGASSFSIGMVLRNHEGSFVAGKTLCQTMVPSVLEAEARAIMEGLHWLCSLSHDMVVLEWDSLINVRAFKNKSHNLLEVGHVLDACRIIIDSKPGCSIAFVKRQANRVAHLVAKLPCSLDCQNVITSPSGVLLEALFSDVS